MKRELSEEAAVQPRALKRLRNAAVAREPDMTRPAKRRKTLKRETNVDIKEEQDDDNNLRSTLVQSEVRKAAESLLCQIYAEVEAACGNESLNGNGEELLTFIRAARVGIIYDDDRVAPTNRTKTRIRDRLVEIEDQGYEHSAFGAASSVLSEIRQTHRIALRRNLVEFADHFDWMLLAICAHSQQFRNFATDNNVKAALRDNFDNLLAQNIASLKLFACSRSLGWERVLSEHDSLFMALGRLQNSQNDGVALHTADQLSHLLRRDERRAKPERTIELPKSYLDRTARHPHELALAADNSVTVPVLQPRDGADSALLPLEKKNIVESRILPGEEYEEQRQNEWPIPDPRWRSRKEDACHVCGNKPTSDVRTDWQSSICQCTPGDLKDHLKVQEPPLYTGDRVELIKAEPFGVGVRSLQRFESGSLLAEAVGEIYPPEDSTEYDQYQDAGRYTSQQLSIEKWKTYRLKHHRGLRVDDTNAVCQIDAAVFGNWTRYLNHSCNANTRLQQYSVGDKVLICVRVEDGKNIGFGEVLTMNYGKQYFIGKRIACRCGEDCCQLWNEKRIGNSRRTLGEARREGAAPDWA
jgi:hypothetical protein